MGNALQKTGAQGSKPTRYGVIWNNNFYLGMATQRNPLKSNVSHIESEFYGDQPCFLGGLNTEISPKLTLIRRPGNSIYNSSSLPAINRFYENRTILYNAAQTQATENIQVVADTYNSVIDVTGPSTDNLIFNKSNGAGSTYFQSVGNTLYFSDGPDQMKYITPDLIWAANQLFQPGDQILDSNGNLQVVQAESSATIADIQVIDSRLGIPGGPEHYFLKITFTSAVYWPANTPVSFSGVTTYTSLNNQTLNVVVNHAYLTPSATVAYFGSPTPTLYGPATDTGTATPTVNTGGGTSGGTVPTWMTSLGALTTDNQLTWQNFGAPVYNWGVTPPTNAPILTPVAGNRQWTANSVLSLWYSIMTLAGIVQVAINSAGGTYITGQTVPTWNTAIPGSGSAGGQTVDGSVIWQNCGPVLTWVASSPYYTFQCVLDSNQNLQIVTNGGGGNSGGSAPSWATSIGSHTTDGALTWTCVGPGSILITGAVQYGYSWVSIDGTVSTSSPVVQQNYGSFVLGPANNALANLTGGFSADQQIVSTWIWRTVQNGSTLFFDSAIPNVTPGTASTWTFTDVIPDTSLNELIEAPIAESSNPPPVGITALAYHLGCIWGAVANSVQYSDGPLVTTGNGNTAWNPGNIFTFPSTVTRLFPTSAGLIVFTTSDIYIIQGLNTASSSLFSAPFLQNIGLSSYDAFTVNGSIVYMYTSDNQIITLDPSSGVSEIGFPIGDQFGPGMGTGTFNPTSTRVTWHVAGSQDKGLYVSDFQGTWWRMTPTPSPESGTTWSPMAQIASGFSCVQSVETTPGTRTLLIAPPLEYYPSTTTPRPTGPILKRDYTTYQDNGTSYPAYAILGSMVLAQPGQIALVESFTTDSVLVGNPISLAIQLDEIAPLSSGYFEPLLMWTPDPEELTPSKSVYAQRFYLSQTQMPAVCRHLQLQINFGTQAVKNELLSLTCFGAYEQSK